jgi:signal transduction histidine kinase
MRLQQVLINLGSNAISSRPGRGGFVSVVVVARGSESVTCVAVRDSGIGITPRTSTSSAASHQTEASTTRAASVRH